MDYYTSSPQSLEDSPSTSPYGSQDQEEIHDPQLDELLATIGLQMNEEGQITETISPSSFVMAELNKLRQDFGRPQIANFLKSLEGFQRLIHSDGIQIAKDAIQSLGIEVFDEYGEPDPTKIDNAIYLIISAEKIKHNGWCWKSNGKSTQQPGLTVRQHRHKENIDLKRYVYSLSDSIEELEKKRALRLVHVFRNTNKRQRSEQTIEEEEESLSPMSSRTQSPMNGSNSSIPFQCIEGIDDQTGEVVIFDHTKLMKGERRLKSLEEDVDHLNKEVKELKLGVTKIEVQLEEQEKKILELLSEKGTRALELERELGLPRKEINRNLYQMARKGVVEKIENTSIWKKNTK